MKRFKLTTAVFLVLRKNNKYLLMRRAGTDYYPGFYSLVSGHLDGDEPATVAMAREAKEEAGLIIEPNRLTLVHTVHSRGQNNDPDDEYLNLYFEPQGYEGTPKICEPDKCDDMNWFDLNELPSNTIPNVVEVIRNIEKSINFSEYGWA
jgi:8-oxo-dGTP diphosphatase